MQLRVPVKGGELHIIETIRFAAGEDKKVAAGLARIGPDLVALDLTPGEMREAIAHAKHGLGLHLSRFNEVWVNYLAAHAPIDPFGEYIAAVRYALDHGRPLAALDVKGRDLNRAKMRKLEKRLAADAQSMTDPKEISIHFREKLYQVRAVKAVERREAGMADLLRQQLARGRRIAAVIPYPASEEISIRLSGGGRIERAEL